MTSGFARFSRCALVVLMLCGTVQQIAAAASEGWRAYERGDFAAARARYERDARSGDRLAQFTVSFGGFEQDHYRIVGTKGEIVLDQGYEYEGPRTMVLKTGGHEHHRRFRPADQFAPELVAFSKAVLNDTDVEPDGEEGLRDVKIMMAIYDSARTGKTVKLS